MKKNKKDLIISILGITLITILVAGGTYAWLTWRSDNNTIVNIGVAGGSLLLDGGGDIISDKNIAPTTQCNHNKYAIQRTITASATNQTKTNMVASIQLKPSVFPTAYRNANVEWVISNSPNNCSSEENIVASGNFSNVTQGNKFTLTTFNVPAETFTSLEKTYYLYIWVNENYGVENVGLNVTDSIQNKSFTLQLDGELTNDPNA